MLIDRTYRVYAPLIRLRHLLPPQKTAGGEGLSTKGRGKGLNQTVRNAGLRMAIGHPPELRRDERLHPHRRTIASHGTAEDGAVSRSGCTCRVRGLGEGDG